MGSFSAFHWIVVLAIVLLVFGTGKLRTIGSDLGSAIKDFKNNVAEDRETATRSDALTRAGETPSAAPIDSSKSHENS